MKAKINSTRENPSEIETLMAEWRALEDRISKLNTTITIKEWFEMDGTPILPWLLQDFERTFSREYPDTPFFLYDQSDVFHQTLPKEELIRRYPKISEDGSFHAYYNAYVDLSILRKNEMLLEQKIQAFHKKNYSPSKIPAILAAWTLAITLALHPSVLEDTYNTIMQQMMKFSWKK